MNLDHSSNASSCPSRFDLDRYLTHELPPVRGAEIGRHVSGCGACTGWSEHYRALQEELARRPAPDFGRRTPLVGHAPRPPSAPARSGTPSVRGAGTRRRRAHALRPLAAAAGLALAAVATWAVVADSTHDRPAPASRQLLAARGGFALHVGVLRGAHTFRASPGDVLREGDRLGFFYSAPRDGFLRVVYIDSNRRVTTIVGGEGTELREVSAGSEVRLDAGATLRDGLGCEVIVAVFSPDATGAVEAERLLETLGSGDTCRPTLPDLEDLEVDMYVVHR